MYKKQLNGIRLLLILMLTFTLLTGCIATKTNESTSVPYEILDTNDIDMENVFGIIEELTSTKYMGRLAGTSENEMAVDYIANYFKEIGLESPNGLVDYRQTYNQKVILTESTPIIRIEDAGGNSIKEFDFLLDYRILNIWQGLKINGSATSKMVVINNSEQLHKDNQELEGKVLLIDNSVAMTQNGANELLQSILQFNKSIEGIIINLDNRRNPESYLVSTVLTNVAREVQAFDEGGPIMAYVTDKVFEELKKASLEEKYLHMKVDYNFKDAEVSNVIGVIPGQDKDLKNEYIIISGHLDHVGDNKNGTYQPGALDNASGTAALMEIARILKETEVAPKRTIVFIAFNGEEEGLFGSNYYVVEDPIYPLNKSVVLNMDMVGSKQIVPLTIGGESHGLKDELYNSALSLGIDATTENSVASDQYHFNNKEVPAVTLIHSEGTKVHTPLDDLNNIDMERMREVLKLVLYYIDGNGY